MTQPNLHFDWIDPDALPGMKGVFRALLAKDPALREHFPLCFWEPGDRERAFTRRESNASPQLWDRMAAEAKRLGAVPLGLDLLDQIRKGQGIFVVAGQQPGFLGDLRRRRAAAGFPRGAPLHSLQSGHRCGSGRLDSRRARDSLCTGPLECRR